MKEPYNEREMEEAQRKHAIISHDDLPQTGEGVNGERLSSVRSSPTDFPDQPQGRVDLGRQNPNLYDRTPRDHSPLEEGIPTSVSHAELVQQSKKYGTDWEAK